MFYKDYGPDLNKRVAYHLAKMKILSIHVINRFNCYCCILIDRQIFLSTLPVVLQERGYNPIFGFMSAR